MNIEATASTTPLTGKEGFSITELVFAAAIMAIVMTLALGTYSSTMLQGREGTFHVRLIDDARSAEQKLVKYIQRGRAISASASQLLIMMPDNTQARIRFLDQDGDINTLEDNYLEYDPDTSVAGDEELVCDYVSAIPAETMFQLVPTSPRTALISFHVGEVPAAGDNLLVGSGYQGVEVRMSSTPRNLGTIYY